MSACRNGWRGGVLRGERVDASTPFRIASLTKFFTAFLTLEAHADGRLDVEAPALDLLRPLADRRAPSVEWRDMRGVDLLRHSMGFDRMKQADPMLTTGMKPPCPHAVAPMFGYRFDFAPGSRYAYGNLNYCLLGVVLANVHQEPYRELLLRRFNRHAAGALSFVDGPYLSEEVAYDARYSEFWGADYWKNFDFKALSSSAGLKTNATSFALLLRSEMSKLRQYTALANKYVLGGVDCSVFMSCYSLMGSYYDDGTQRVNVWRGNLVGSAAMLIVREDGSALVWLGAGASPTQHRSDKQMFEYWIRHM